MLEKLPLDRLTPANLWGALDAPTRKLAAEAVYDRDSDDEASRAEADHAIAETLRFRIAAVRKLPASKRVDYVVRAVRPDDNLASTLLRCLHLGRRRELLARFLDELGLAHDNGVIDADEEFDSPDGDRLSGAVTRLRDAFDDSEVDLYLASLLAMDRERWGALTVVVQREVEERSG